MFSYSTIDEIDGVTRIVTPTNGSPLLDARKELIDIHGINLTDVLNWEEKMISLARENQ